MSVWNKLGNFAGAAVKSAPVKELTATATQAAQDRLASEVNGLFEKDRKIVQAVQPRMAAPVPELERVKTVETGAEQERDGLPRLAVAATIAGVVLVGVAAWMIRKGGKR